MGKMGILIDDKLEADFRRAIFSNMGMKNGHIKIAMEQAITMWIKSMKRKST